MTEQPHDSESANKRQGLALHCTLLTVALLIPLPVVAWFGYRSSGVPGVWAAVIAASVCGAGAIIALVLAGLTRATPAAVQATLLGMLFRTGLPLVLGILIQQSGGELARAGVFGMILGYYLWALVVETLLSVRLIGRGGSGVVRV